MRILLMSDGLQGTLACIEGLGRRGHSIVLVTGAIPSTIARSSFVSKCVTPIGIDGSLSSKVAALVRMVGDEQIDVVIPLQDSDARIVAAASEHYPGIAAFVTPSANSVSIASDKISTLEIATQLGIVTPASAVLEDAALVPAMVSEFGLPMVVKLPVATASMGTFLVKTRGEAKRLAARLPDGRVLVQRFVEGAFVGVTGFADRGKLLEYFAFRVPREIETAGTPAYALAGEVPGLVAMLETLCRHLQWTGGIDLDALCDARGRLHLLEINPRFSGTLVFADKLGIDLPGCYVEHVAGMRHGDCRGARSPRDVLFVSVNEEADAHAANPALRKLGKLLKKAYPTVDSLYLDDPGLVEAQALSAQRRRIA